MTTEPIETAVTEIPDDLDAFTDLFLNKKAPVKEEAPAPAEDDTLADDEPQEVEADGEGTEEETPDEPAAKAKPKNRFQERIDTITARARDAERKAAELEARLAAVETKQSPTEPAPTAKTVVEGPSPDDRDANGDDKYPLGEFDPNYIRDLTRHTIKVEQDAARQAQEAEQTKRQMAQEQEQLQTQWVEKLNPAIEKYPDFIEKAVALEEAFEGLDPAYSKYLADTIKAMDNGPDVLNYLANNLDEAKRFVQMGPVPATLALGRYEAMFASPTVGKATKVSNAPLPPQVNKGSKARVTVPDDTDDLDAFAEKFFAKRR